MPLNFFDKIAANETSMQSVVVENKEWTLATITRWDDMEGQAGGSPRAQYRAQPGLTPDKTHEIKFNIMIPCEWQYYNKEVATFDIHGRSVGAQTFTLYIKNNEFLAVIKEEPGTAIRASYTYNFITDHPYQFKIITHITNDASKGYYHAFINGQEWFYLYGVKTMFDGESDQGPYWKVGPYVPLVNWPDGIDWRRILLQV